MFKQQYQNRMFIAFIALLTLIYSIFGNICDIQKITFETMFLTTSMIFFLYIAILFVVVYKKY